MYISSLARDLMSNPYEILARPILTSGAKYKNALLLKMFLFIYKNDFPPKKRGIFLKTDEFNFEAFKVIQALWGHHDWFAA